MKPPTTSTKGNGHKQKKQEIQVFAKLEESVLRVGASVASPNGKTHKRQTMQPKLVRYDRANSAYAHPYMVEEKKVYVYERGLR